MINSKLETQKKAVEVTNSLLVKADGAPVNKGVLAFYLKDYLGVYLGANNSFELYDQQLKAIFKMRISQSFSEIRFEPKKRLFVFLSGQTVILLDCLITHREVFRHEFKEPVHLDKISRGSLHVIGLNRLFEVSLLNEPIKVLSILRNEFKLDETSFRESSPTLLAHLNQSPMGTKETTQVLVYFFKTAGAHSGKVVLQRHFSFQTPAEKNLQPIKTEEILTLQAIVCKSNCSEAPSIVYIQENSYKQMILMSKELDSTLSLPCASFLSKKPSVVLNISFFKVGSEFKLFWLPHFNLIVIGQITCPVLEVYELDTLICVARITLPSDKFDYFYLNETTKALEAFQNLVLVSKTTLDEPSIVELLEKTFDGFFSRISSEDYLKNTSDAKKNLRVLEALSRVCFGMKSPKAVAFYLEKTKKSMLFHRFVLETISKEITEEYIQAMVNWIALSPHAVLRWEEILKKVLISRKLVLKYFQKIAEMKLVATVDESRIFMKYLLKISKKAEPKGGAANVVDNKLLKEFLGIAKQSGLPEEELEILLSYIPEGDAKKIKETISTKNVFYQPAETDLVLREFLLKHGKIFQKPSGESTNSILCGICFEKPQNHELNPCKHVYCEPCAKSFKECPNCRVKVDEISKLFFS